MIHRQALSVLLASALAAAPLYAYAQPTPNAAPTPNAGPAPGAATTDSAPPAPTPVANQADVAPAPSHVRLAEGTQIHFRLEQALSSATAAQGDEFSITTTDPIDLGNGVIIPAGFHGKGEVSSVEKNGMMGKAGQLSVRLDYVRIGSTKVRLRSNQSSEGQSNQSSAIVLSLLVTPLFLLMHGKNATIPKGQAVSAYVDDDTDIALPATPPTDD